MTRLCTTSFLEYLVMLHTVGKDTAASIISCSHSKGISDLSLTSNTYFVETPVDSRIRPRCPFRKRNARLGIKKYLVDMHSREYLPYLDTFMVSSVMPAGFMRRIPNIHTMHLANPEMGNIRRNPNPCLEIIIKLSGYSPKSSTMKLLHLLAGLAALVPVSVAESDGYFLCEEGLNYCGHTLSTMGESSRSLKALLGRVDKSI